MQSLFLILISIFFTFNCAVNFGPNDFFVAVVVLGLFMDGSTTATTSDWTVGRQQQCGRWAQVYYVVHVWRQRAAAANWRRTIVPGTRHHVRGPPSSSQRPWLVRMVVRSRVFWYVKAITTIHNGDQSPFCRHEYPTAINHLTAPFYAKRIHTASPTAVSTPTRL